VEVSYDEVGVQNHVEAERRRRQDHAGETAEHEGDEELIAHSIGALKVTEPRHIVLTQLKIFTASARRSASS
jgi:hypothetical protein